VDKILTEGNMNKLIYYTTVEDGLICFDPSNGKHKPVIQNRGFENFGQQFWVHDDYVFISDASYQIYAYNLTTSDCERIHQSRATNMQVVDGYLLFYNMDDNVSVQALALSDIHDYLNRPTGSSVRTKTLLENGMCCYGKHPWRDGKSVVFYVIENEDKWSVCYKTLDGKENEVYFSVLKKIPIDRGEHGIIFGALNQTRGLRCVKGSPRLFVKYSLEYDLSPFYESVDCVLKHDEPSPGNIELATELFSGRNEYYSVCENGFSLVDGYAAYSLYAKTRGNNRFVVFTLDGRIVLDKEVDWYGEIMSDGEFFYCQNYQVNPNTQSIKIFSNNNICAVQIVIRK
jgi:hypothetical protein